MYKIIVMTMCQAAAQTFKCQAGSQNRNQVIVGWNAHSAHRAARFHFQAWLLHGKPSCGLFMMIVCRSLGVFLRQN